MRRLVTFSFIMYAVCFYWRAYTFEPGMDFGASAWPQFIQGFAVACFFMPLTTITLSGLPPETTGGGIKPLQLYANAGGVYRHVDNHDHVDQPRVDAPCAVD
ncbi:multidrug resistance protein B [Escherichia coli]|uniref:Multidrug resistance protein B n=1 Tax=Escherichia coli TaxID=562 RepID=A0A377K1U7_ECOLX|nr:multidrug resistance protein B [Escherichia coli]